MKMPKYNVALRVKIRKDDALSECKRLVGNLKVIELLVRHQVFKT